MNALRAVLASVILLAAAPSAAEAPRAIVFFDPDSPTLTDGGRSVLTAAFDKRAVEAGVVHVVGSADRAESVFNLAERRAYAVVEALVELGVPVGLVTTVANSDDGLAARRVGVVIEEVR